MSKINKGIAVFIVFLALVVLLGLLRAPSDKPMPTNEPIAGLFIQFKDGTTEPEVRTILENYNLSTYKLDYNFDNGGYKYYIKVDKDNMRDVKNELRKEENWTDPVLSDIKKDNYYIIPVTEQAIQDKNFLVMLEENNLQVKKFVWCVINFRDGSKKGISEGYAAGIKHQIEMNENVFYVGFDYMEG
jgi:hypothetical protein